jgi:glyoxylase I family protein
VSSPQTESPFRFWAVRYQVKDVARSVDFYTKVLGFNVEGPRSPAFAGVTKDGFKLLLSGPGSSGARPMPDGKAQSPGGWNRIVLEVKDLPSRLEAMKKEGFKFRNELEVGPGGKQIQLLDPDGNPIELFEPAG